MAIKRASTAHWPAEEIVPGRRGRRKGAWRRMSECQSQVTWRDTIPLPRKSRALATSKRVGEVAQYEKHGPVPA